MRLTHDDATGNLLIDEPHHRLLLDRLPFVHDGPFGDIRVTFCVGCWMSRSIQNDLLSALALALFDGTRIANTLLTRGLPQNHWIAEVSANQRSRRLAERMAEGSPIIVTEFENTVLS